MSNITAKDIADALDKAKELKKKMQEKPSYNPEDIITWMNKIEAKQKEIQDVRESLVMLKQILVGMNPTMTPEVYLNDTKLALVILTELMEIIIGKLTKIGAF